MIFLGLAVAAVAAAVGVGVILDNSGPAQLTVFGHEVIGLDSQWHVFMAGAAVAIVFMTGMMLATLGIGRAVRLRRELRDLRDEHQESMTTLEMEKRQLQRELARARSEGGTSPLPGQPVVPRSS
jgi:predicted ABC-type transport system involved in lysophospholipase L1 biosynthesis ATPase subunit